MAKKLQVTFSNSAFSKLIKYIASAMEQQNGVYDRKWVQNSGNLFDPSTPKEALESFHQDIAAWWAGDKTYLSVPSKDVKGLSIRLYKADFDFNGKTLKVKGGKFGSLFMRQRNAVTTELKTVKLGNLTEANCAELLKSAITYVSSNNLGIKLIEKQKVRHFDDECSVTLEEFLFGMYLESRRYQNPKTADLKVNVICRHFKGLLKLPLSQIKADLVRQWLTSIERKLTRKQIQAGESMWKYSPSTVKEVICTFRACVQYAKERGLIKDHDLYSLPRIRIDNQIVRYLSDEEEIRLYKAINDRNTSKLEQRQRTIEHRNARRLPTPMVLENCAFADHVTPFIVLFKETGIRPGTIRNSRWSDIDMEGQFFRVRKALDKRGVCNFIPLNDLAMATIKEWKKHYTHKQARAFFKNSGDAWLFPSPVNPAEQLSCFKKSWEGIIKAANIQNFRMYDLRHDFASKVMLQTGNIYMVSQLLNHKQIETTKRYAHLMDKSRIDAVRALDRVRHPNALPDFMK